MILVTHVINLKGSQVVIAVPVITVYIIYWGSGSLCLPFLGFISPYNMVGPVTVVTFFLFEKTTFMIMISEAAVARLITFFFEGLASFLSLGFLHGLDLSNKSTGIDSLPPWRASTSLLDCSIAMFFHYSYVKWQLLEFEFQKLKHHSLISNNRNQSLSLSNRMASLNL